jgi:ribonuclease VapC
MFVDASAMVAILIGEEEDIALFHCLEGANHPITSALAIFETASAVCRKKGLSVEAAEREVRGFLEQAQVRVVPMTDAEAHGALAAYARFGKGRGHPAQLNMGDCFAYACARTHDVPLLFVGNDFSRTDIPSALA